MTRKRPLEYKPLLFTTTIRNPQRIKSLLWLLEQFNGQILTNKLTIEIIFQLIKYGLYRPMKVPQIIKDKWNTPKGLFADCILTDEEVVEIMNNNPQNHKEASFDKGYPSRFATIFNFTKELGFAYFKINEPIFISELGLRLAKILSVDIIDEHIIITEKNTEIEQMIFLHSMCKYQRRNPFIRVLNDNVPLLLLIETIKFINSNPKFNNCGISRKELPLLIFWKNNDSIRLYERIRKLRQQYGYNPSDEVIIDICINEIMEGKMKRFDSKSIMIEYPDEFIRKMRITGLISLRGAGRFIDINHNEDEKIDYILKTYSTYPTFKTEKGYFDYMATIDNNLINIQTTLDTVASSESLLVDWVDKYSWDNIKKELNILSIRKDSKDLILKFIPKPTRLEFLTALAIKKKLPSVRVVPNYCCDDTGLPTSTAGGGKGDIECFEKSRGILVEVTMASGRQQTMMEIWPIERHLEEFMRTYTNNAQCLFIAPSIYSDSERQIKFVESDKGLKIRPYLIENFLTYLENNNYLFTE